ncbi:CotH kinase family protein [Sedimentibacter sp. zth1]|uniref:CotH kinase family protein n=1 Tax=Sedimentibacter sp. zth1 TaxID=2816908 RepID=UPI001A91D36E|nr:CotH kinase family protein [Sedimentibacter sp. zth1]QSX05774.1 CotH kinase family protein [Sedimentibacter sp. zth1]
MNKLLIKKIVFFILFIILIAAIFIDIDILSNKGIDYTNILCINEIMSNNKNCYCDSYGYYENWVEIFNNSKDKINLENFGLSNNNKNLYKWVFPKVYIEPNSYLTVWLSGKNLTSDTDNLHTNFKIDINKDKSLILSSNNSSWSNIMLIQNTDENISYGRQPDGSENIFVFEGGTLNSSNTINPLLNYFPGSKLEKPFFSHKGGCYDSQFNLELSTINKCASIYYTLDGTDPTTSSIKYTAPILIEEKENMLTIVRAKAFCDDFSSSDIVTNSYFVQNNNYYNSSIPIVSIVSNNKNLYDYKTGILVKGEVYDEWLKNGSKLLTNVIPANYTQEGRKWERKANIEIFKYKSQPYTNQGIGIRVFGGYSRENSIKSLACYARDCYDANDYFSLNYLGNKDIKLNKLVLRTPSSDSNGALFRDDLNQSLVPSNLNIQKQEAQTCILFLNGIFMGIHSIKEAYNNQYFKSYYGIEYDDIVILKNPTDVTGTEINEGFPGDEMYFNKMYNFIKANDMSKEANYNYIIRFLDIDNFIEYYILQIYCANRDWPGNNVKVWRKRTEGYVEDASYGHDGRWRYLLYDTDYSLGLHTSTTPQYDFDMISFATDETKTEWPNPNWSTLIFRKLLDNDKFKTQFINTFADRLNTIYKEDNVLDSINKFADIYEPYVQEHINVWQIFKGNINLWYNQISILKDFVKSRPMYVRNHIIDYFKLSGIYNLSLYSTKGGKVEINGVNVDLSSNNFEGIYFKDMEITLKAIADEGFEFSCWDGDYTSVNEVFVIKPSQDVNFNCYFKKTN